MSRPAGAQLSGARVTVMGLGLFGGGVAAARFAAQRGARVTVTDLRDADTLAPAVAALRELPLEFVLGEHREADFTGADLIIASPAVPPTSRYLELARRAGIAITSEIALFLDEVRAPVYAITGTQGKSSTTHLLAQLLGAEGRPVHLGGNIGRALLADVDVIEADHLCAVELSSYQLAALPEECQRTGADAPIAGAAVTNVLSDHLERHGTREEYARAKLRLFELLAPGSPAILPPDPLPVEWCAPKGLRPMRAGGPELRMEAGGFWLDGECLGQVAESPFPAPFQNRNLLLALGLARCAGVSPGALARTIPNLRGMPHRLDRVGELDGRPLWDNTVSTTPDSTVSAVEALPPGQVVLLGGRVKDLPLDPLVEALRDRRATAVVFGEARDSWPARFRAARIPCKTAPGALEALVLARELDGAGLLLSPACSSFDAFPNFQARADALLALAEELGLVRAHP